MSPAFLSIAKLSYCQGQVTLPENEEEVIYIDYVCTLI
jgi:hypothetical protein